MRRMLLGLAAGATLVLVLPLGFIASGGGQGSAAAAAGGSCTLGDTREPEQPVALNAEQMNNARIVAVAARGSNLPERAAAIGLMTAMQESSLTNVNHGDLAGPTSRGLFQQKPEFYPGVDVTEPARAATAFFARLVQVPDYLTIPMAQAAQAVQRSADGSRYTRWQTLGLRLAAVLYGRVDDQVTCTGGNPNAGPGNPPSDRVTAALEAARSQLGRPYVWGGGNATGPTGNPPGYDCSGLMIYAWARAGVTLTHSSREQYNAGAHIPLAEAQVGDLIFLATTTANPATIHHVAMIYTTGQIIEAQTFGVPVHVRSFAGPAEPEIMPLAVRLTG
jgi:peptidoglycan DL-endopeptidase CwlO